MHYASVCSGIEAATVAWHPLGWRPAFFSDIDPFARAVLDHHYPEVPCHGDFRTIRSDGGPVDLLVGGTPCQSFSIAGPRTGMDDERGQLALDYIRLADELGSRWVVWENVAGVLSMEDGEAFRCFLSGLVRWDVPVPDGGWQSAGVIGAGPVNGAYGVAWRVLDAEYVRVDGFPYAVPQRRRRVILVGYIGDWRRAAAVLFERESLSGHPPPCRRPGQGIAENATAGTATGGGLIETFGGNNTSGPIDVAPALLADNQRLDFESETFVVFAENGWVVRCLMPVECERLQGFPDDYTLVPYRGKPAKDAPRYKALGNSMPVNVMRWVGRRIGQVEAVING